MTKQFLAKGDQVVGSLRNPRQAESLMLNWVKALRLLSLMRRTQPVLLLRVRLSTDPLMCFVNNAGIIGPADHEQSIDQMDFDAFAETLNINTLGPLRVAQAFKSHLLKGENPRLATISSQMGGMDSAKHDRLAYRASKSAVNKVVQAMATGWPDIYSACTSPAGYKQIWAGRKRISHRKKVLRASSTFFQRLHWQTQANFLNWDGTERVW